MTIRTCDRLQENHHKAPALCTTIDTPSIKLLVCQNEAQIYRPSFVMSPQLSVLLLSKEQWKYFHTKDIVFEDSVLEPISTGYTQMFVQTAQKVAAQMLSILLPASTHLPRFERNHDSITFRYNSSPSTLDRLCPHVFAKFLRSCVHHRRTNLQTSLACQVETALGYQSGFWTRSCHHIHPGSKHPYPGYLGV